MDSLIANQVIYAAIASWLIEHFKNSKWFPWATQETNKLNKLLAALFSVLGTASIFVASAWEPSTHALTLTITGLTLANGLHFGWLLLSQYIFIKGAYHLGIKPANHKETV